MVMISSFLIIIQFIDSYWLHFWPIRNRKKIEYSSHLACSCFFFSRIIHIENNRKKIEWSAYSELVCNALTVVIIFIFFCKKKEIFFLSHYSSQIEFKLRIFAKTKKKSNKQTKAKMSTRDANTQDHHHVYQYVGPYRLEKTLGKGQTGKFESETIFKILFDFKYFFL